MKGSNILVVEDEMIIAMEIRATLKKLGYKVAGSVINGYDAIQTAGEKRPDLVLMDIRLKGDMDGIEAARKIMELYDIPVIFLTGNSDKTTVERAVELKPAGFLIKPFKERELFGNIEMAIHKHKVSNQIKQAGTEKVSDSIAKELSNNIIALISTDNNGIINRANNSAVELIGIDKNKIIGKKVSDIFSMSSKPATNTHYDDEISIIWPDGISLKKADEDLKVNLKSGFIVDELGKIQDFLFTLNDDNENKNENSSSLTLLSHVIDSLNEVIFTVDKKMNVIQYNNNFLEFLKRVGVSLYQLKRPFYEIKELSSFAEADEYVEIFRTNTPIKKTKEFKTDNDDINYFNISLIPDYDGKNVTQIITIIDDITPVIHAKENTHHITDGLEEIEQSLTEINAIINDIKKPLLNILKISESNKEPSSPVIVEKTYEIISLLENFDIQKIKYEDAIDHIYYLSKTANS